MTLGQIISIALENNFNIKEQQFALARAEAQYRQTKGKLDIEIGAEAKHEMKNNSIDGQDPHFAYTYSFYNDDSINGIYINNTLQHLTNGSLYVKKLFSFGLESKLSYSIRRTYERPHYIYSDDFDLDKYKQEKGRNIGEMSLEFTLPLFKSFKNSITNMQLQSAKAAIEQMRFQLQDAMANTIIDISKAYWDYYIACQNHEQLTVLQKKIEKRCATTKQLVDAGVRSRVNLLSLQVNQMENESEIEDSLIKISDAKMKLLQLMGADSDLDIGKPVFSFNNSTFEKNSFPTLEMITEEYLNSITEKRANFLALKKKIEVAEKKVASAKIDKRPDANLNFSVGSTGTKYDNDPLYSVGAAFWNIRGVNLSGSLSAKVLIGNNDKNGALDQSVADYNSAVNDYDKARNELASQLINITKNLDTYRKKAENAEKKLSLQNSLYSTQESLFDNGFINADTLIEQDQKNINARTAYFQTLVNYYTQILQFKYLTGTMLDVETELEE